MPFATPKPARAQLSDLYDAMADRWQSTIERLGYGAAYSAFFEGLGPLTHRRIADLGTGTGAFAAAYLGACTRKPDACILLDTSAAMLDIARREIAGQGITAHTAVTPLGADIPAPRACDALLAAHVIEHTQDPAHTLSWCRTCLCPGGTLYLAVSRPHWCTALLRWKWGHRAYRPDQMQAILRQAGFTDICHIPFAKGPPSRTSAAYVATAP
ncbi:MAG: class I SAM-dependent methyltransferase [Pseudomonadota bacterium]